MLTARRFALILTLFTVGVASLGAQTSARLAEGGWQALRDGNADRALSLFREALTMNPSDPGLHLGAGAAQHVLGREDEARRSLEFALKGEPRLTPAAALLGEIVYRQGDVEAAIRTYETAIGHNAADSSMKMRLEQWRKEAALQNGFGTRKDDRFSVMFEGPAEERLAARATAVLDAAFWRIGKVIGQYPSNSIAVVLYTERQFRDITRAPEWSDGLYDGRIRIPVRGASQNLVAFDRVLTHELTHAMVTSLAPRGVPVWLHEGLAQYFEPGDALGARRRLRAARLFVPLSDLEGAFHDLETNEAVIAYDESLFAVNTLMERVGKGVSFLIQDLGQGVPVSQAIQRFGFSYSEFQNQVLERLQ